MRQPYHTLNAERTKSSAILSPRVVRSPPPLKKPNTVETPPLRQKEATIEAGQKGPCGERMCTRPPETRRLSVKSGQ